MDRRSFINKSCLLAAGTLTISKANLLWAENSPIDMAIVENGEPAQLVQESLKLLGGMSRFISKGDEVVIKANMSWDRRPKQAATTNPQVVKEVVTECFNAGAKKVILFDNTLNEPRRCYRNSGIQKAAESVGADVQFMHDRKYKNVRIPDGEMLKAWEIYDEILEADKIINLPIAKHHSISGVSFGMKNFMGVLGGNRGAIHRGYNTKIVDINTAIQPTLTILDAYRILLRNGPSGGNLADVALKKTIVAGIDRVAVDSYGVKELFGLEPEEIEFLTIAEKRGLGKIDYTGLKMKKLVLEG